MFPPYQQYIIVKDSSFLQRSGTSQSIDSFGNAYHLTITFNIRNPQSVIKQKFDNKKIIEYFSRDNDFTDAEMRLLLEYNQKIKLNTTEENVFKKLTRKLQDYTMSRCKKIHKIYMEKPLIIGNYITETCIDKYPGLMNDKIDFEKFVTLEEIKGKIKNDVSNSIGWGVPSLLEDYYSRMPSYEQRKKYNILKTTNIDLQVIYNILNYGHSRGNYEFTKALAEKGLLIDEVLAFNDYITSQGLKNIKAIYLLYNQENANNELVLTEEGNKILNKQKSIFSDKHILENITFKDLQRTGIKLLPEDVDKKKDFDFALKNGRIGAIRDVYNQFMEYIEKDRSIHTQEL